MRFTLPTLAFLAALAPATLAQELATQPEGRHGIAMGTWTDPTGSQDGQMQGLLRRADGTLVFGITANVSGLGRDRYGKIQGQLVALDDGPMSGPAISVAGMWMEAGQDHGVFDALLVLDGIHPLVPRLVVGSIQGEFGVMRGGGPEMKASYGRAGDFAPTRREPSRIQHRSADVAIDAGQEAAAQYLRQDHLVGRALNADKSSHRSADVAIDAGQESAAQYLRQDDLVGRFLNKDAGPSAADVATDLSRGRIIVLPYDRSGTASPVDSSREPMATKPALVPEQAAPQGLPWDLGRQGGTRAADLAPKSSFRPVDVAPRGLNVQAPPVTKTSIFVAIWQL